MNRRPKQTVSHHEAFSANFAFTPKIDAGRRRAITPVSASCGAPPDQAQGTV